jgi:LysR family transcriptional regulator, glycine cleavage system transcriptional activator
MPNHLPPLNALRCFEKAAKLESFAKAADELHLTHSAVSRQIKNLEDCLGVTLFDRRNRRVYLTEPGRRLHAATTAAFRTLKDACEEIIVKPSSPLVLSCEPTLTQRWLIPRLTRFSESNPDVLIHIVAAGGPVQFERDRIDLAVRRDDFQWDCDTQSFPIVEETVGPVLSPSLCREGDAEHILSLPQLHTATRLEAWDRWCADSGYVWRARQNHTFEHFYLSIQAAEAGLGVAIGPYPLVADGIRSGRLVAPFGFTANKHSYVLLTKIDVNLDPRLATVLDWLKTEASDLVPPAKLRAGGEELA